MAEHVFLIVLRCVDGGHSDYRLRKCSSGEQRARLLDIHDEHILLVVVPVAGLPPPGPFTYQRPHEGAFYGGQTDWGIGKLSRQAHQT